MGPVDGAPRDYLPGKMFRFKIRGDPGAKVSLVAVDNAVYLLSRDRLTQKKVCFFGFGKFLFYNIDNRLKKTIAMQKSFHLLLMEPSAQIWDVVEHGDIGCTRGGGRDANGVFQDAGLLFSSSRGFQTPNRKGIYQHGASVESLNFLVPLYLYSS